MNNDFKRPLGDTSRPPTELPSAQVDPVEPSTRPPEPVYEKKKRSKAIPFLVFLLLLALAVAAALYYLWERERSEAANTRTALSSAQQENAVLKDASNDTAANNGRDFAPQSAINLQVYNHLDAYRSEKPLAVQPYEVKIKYMTDTFARVEVVAIDPNDKTKELGTKATVFLKKVARDGVSENWTIISTHQQPLTDANKTYLKETFGVTDDVFTVVRPE